MPLLHLGDIDTTNRKALLAAMDLLEKALLALPSEDVSQNFGHEDDIKRFMKRERYPMHNVPSIWAALKEAIVARRIVLAGEAIPISRKLLCEHPFWREYHAGITFGAASPLHEMSGEILSQTLPLYHQNAERVRNIVWAYVAEWGITKPD